MPSELPDLELMGFPVEYVTCHIRSLQGEVCSDG